MGSNTIELVTEVHEAIWDQVRDVGSDALSGIFFLLYWASVLWLVWMLGNIIWSSRWMSFVVVAVIILAIEIIPRIGNWVNDGR